MIVFKYRLCFINNIEMLTVKVLSGHWSKFSQTNSLIVWFVSFTSLYTEVRIFGSVLFCTEKFLWVFLFFNAWFNTRLNVEAIIYVKKHQDFNTELDHTTQAFETFTMLIKCKLVCKIFNECGFVAPPSLTKLFWVLDIWSRYNERMDFVDCSWIKLPIINIVAVTIS